MASFGKLQRRVRNAYFKKDYIAWKKAMTALGLDVMFDDDDVMPWDEKISGNKEWSHIHGKYVRITNVNNEVRTMLDRLDPFNNGYRRRAQLTCVKPDPDRAIRPLIVGIPGVCGSMAQAVSPMLNRPIVHDGIIDDVDFYKDVVKTNLGYDYDNKDFIDSLPIVSIDTDDMMKEIVSKFKENNIEDRIIMDSISKEDVDSKHYAMGDESVESDMVINITKKDNERKITVIKERNK